MNKSKASEPEWQSLKTKMETKANEMFKMWIKRVILQLKQDLEQNLRLDEKSNNDHGNSGYGYLLKKLQKSKLCCEQKKRCLNKKCFFLK